MPGLEIIVHTPPRFLSGESLAKTPGQLNLTQEHRSRESLNLPCSPQRRTSVCLINSAIVSASTLAGAGFTRYQSAVPYTCVVERRMFAGEAKKKKKKRHWKEFKHDSHLLATEEHEA